jgi:hypothetical protein
LTRYNEDMPRFNNGLHRELRRVQEDTNRAILRLPFVRAILRLPFLLRLPFAFVLPAVVLGGMAYYGGHTGIHNGARTFGEAVKIGVAFGIFGVATYVVVSAVSWLRDLIFGREPHS